ncbi:hypothetical protein DL93DRAFT_1478245 [Clavulina sp. PMI_390]|nr:hypothetical protein DL93DRAFT_1478245 [Clavulina sp. PMI_390]
MGRISLPPSHPNSIHPCLLNACYLGACASNGGVLAEFKSYFVQRTRYFLQQSLTFADRTTHFLWGSLILAIFYVQEQRLVECVTVAETTARFALACGLNLPNQFRKEDNGSKGRESLLPLPKNKAETDERIRLAHSIYAGCQVLPFLCGSDPSFTYHDGWSQFWETSFSTDQGSKVLITEEEIWRSNLRLKVSFLDTFERVQKLRRASMMTTALMLSLWLSKHKSLPKTPRSNDVGLNSPRAQSTSTLIPSFPMPRFTGVAWFYTVCGRAKM